MGAFVVNLGGKGQLLRNVTAGAGHWLEIQLIGTKSNRDGIGATVEVVANGMKQKSQRVAGSGYLSQDDWRVHFGLGTNARVTSITVVWPSGTRQVLENVAADQVLKIQEKKTVEK